VNILVVEDDAEMARLLVQGLEEESYAVDLARDGASALVLSKSGAFDVVLLDVMLPGIDGIEVARQLRCRKQDIGVLMLTARDALPDIVKGLDAGADDYLTKPFSFQELLARIRSIGRRSAPKPKNVLEVANLVLETGSFRTFRSGHEIKLSFTEFRLLELLVRNHGRIVPRSAIVETLWGDRREIEENTLDAFVRLLRLKIDDQAAVKLIQTHRGHGYSIGAPCATESPHSNSADLALLHRTGIVVHRFFLDLRSGFPSQHSDHRKFRFPHQFGNCREAPGRQRAAGGRICQLRTPGPLEFMG
jgi:DNA-binding response OmpR family regulator